MEKLLEKLREIVVTEGCDKGVVWLSAEGPTHYDADAKCQVYDHENFSPLGDALIELHDMIAEMAAEQYRCNLCGGLVRFDGTTPQQARR